LLEATTLEVTALEATAQLKQQRLKQQHFTMDHSLILYSDAQITDKIDIILDLLYRGANPSVKNGQGNTFLKVSMGLKTELIHRINSRDGRFFTKLMQNTEQVEQFITLGDDTFLTAIFSKFCELTATHSDGGLNHCQKS
jgi:hypothetical protein